MGQRSAVWLAAALVLGACSSTPGVDSYEITGIVSEFIAPEQPGDPVGDADVTFISDTRLIAQTSTDSGGHYRIRVTTDYPFGQVRAQKAGFVPGEETVFFDTPQRRIDIQIRAE